MDKELELDKISDELAQMNINDFSNLVEKHDLGIEDIDDMFYQLREIIYKERNKDEN